MAHDFLGTFTKSQWERFLTFARSQVPLINARITHLAAERRRIGTVSFTYGPTGLPTEFIVTPPTSYLGKLVAAYEVQGGNPFMDLRIRASNQPVFVIRGSEVEPVQYMSNGEVIGAKGLADAPSAELVRQAQELFFDTLKSRFSRLERKIRRMVDYSDELTNEINALAVLAATVQVNGSLEYVAEQIENLFTDPNYRAIYDDAGKDPFGLTAYAPFSSYDVAKPVNGEFDINRVSESAQRQGSGFVGPGETA